MQRYFVTEKNGQLELQAGDEHHIKNVMRLKNKDQVICLCNGKSYLCEINDRDQKICLRIVEELKQDTELSKELILYQAVIKNDHFDLVVQKATELGVKQIVPTICERSVVKVDNEKTENKKLMRYEKIVKEASEQSHRNDLCTISPYCQLKKISLPKDTLGLLAFEGNGNIHSFPEALKLLPQYEKIAVIVGPEGGFTKEEVHYLQSIGFINISLGKRILRSETASLYALSVLAFYLEGLANG